MVCCNLLFMIQDVGEKIKQREINLHGVSVLFRRVLMVPNGPIDWRQRLQEVMAVAVFRWVRRGRSKFSF